MAVSILRGGVLKPRENEDDCFSGLLTAVCMEGVEQPVLECECWWWIAIPLFFDSRGLLAAELA